MRALRAKWILNYLDAATGPWKQVLDQRLECTRLGRLASLSTYPIEILVGPLQEQDESHLPLFWDDALQDSRALRLSPLTNTRAGILSQPIWCNPLFTIKKLKLNFQELWESHDTLQIHDLIETDGSKYTHEKLWQYFTGGESADTHINYKGRTHKRNRIMTSWDKILESLPPDYWPTIPSRNAEK